MRDKKWSIFLLQVFLLDLGFAKYFFGKYASHAVRVRVTLCIDEEIPRDSSCCGAKAGGTAAPNLSLAALYPPPVDPVLSAERAVFALAGI